MQGVLLAPGPGPELGPLRATNSRLPSITGISGLCRKYIRTKSRTYITTSSGTAKSIHWKKGMLTPANFSIMAMPIRFGGVPTGVPMPPAEEA